ncbi:hypothetical protein AB205_0007010 [Aquarana catesbeiana]|uniref:Secreted protein n=1 Tax=Aquarana catesbeiana TaxID=8400 RepID=A0A2G9QHT1_AQUCT|nr:hypothetical protein AB205_0007010 [Aquarana catesbeiana]
MCFSLLLYILKWQLSCSWTHFSFVGNIVRSANKTPCFVQMHKSIHFSCPISLKISFLSRWICN